ncbi:branched-chain amino acid ABC transporter substrate-binding protein [Chryseobacterium soldanellicola]|uniref:branched-chain amino acid ABC transporter substrate-binding protein n=1 Tax=Chryseobacterium soldanellicola TaxID=311333 RepID=UPI001113C069|nr:branched-chain amino acid ABC transporter substrate-binding protein [Chryseobacterium soldanellicola]
MDFFDFFDAASSALELLSNAAPDFEKDESLIKKKKPKYVIEKISLVLILISSGLLFWVLRDPLPVQNPFQSIVIAILIGIFITSTVCLAIYFLESFSFKSFFSMLFFCTSLIAFFTASVLCLYFKSGLF